MQGGARRVGAGGSGGFGHALNIPHHTSGAILGTSTWPVTFQMTGVINGSFAAFMLIIIAFYAGELAWREREMRLDQFVDVSR